MGYFNYFIKCIIRNVTHKLLKPKFFITFLLCIIILFFCFKNFGYCATDPNVQTVNPTDSFVNEDGYSDGYIQYDNNYLTLRTMQEQLQKDLIAKLYALYEKSPDTTLSFITGLFNELKTGVSGTHKGFYVENGPGSSQFSISSYFPDSMTFQEEYGAYIKDGQYFLNVTYISTTGWARQIFNNDTFSSGATSKTLTIPLAFTNVFVTEWIDLFKHVGLVTGEYESLVLQYLSLIAQQSAQNTANVVDKLEEQNKIQQEQNDFLQQAPSDSDITVDSFDNIDSNDITSEGLNGIFTNIYNSITSWNSKNISLPIPYTNESIIIPANYTENMLNSSGASWIINFINSIYYFIVARFIIYSITGIINSIKSGSILETDSKNNITTDML